MSDTWMPSAEQVREAYSIDAEDEYRDPINAPANRRANERYFDRWLKAHDAEVAAQAFEAAARVVRAYPSSHSQHVAAILDERAANTRVADQNGEQP